MNLSIKIEDESSVLVWDFTKKDVGEIPEAAHLYLGKWIDFKPTEIAKNIPLIVGVRIRMAKDNIYKKPYEFIFQLSPDGVLELLDDT